MASASVIPSLSGGDLTEFITYDNVIFHHLPNYFAPSFLVATLVHAAGFGAVLLDILTNLSFDFRLLRSEGWRDPLKVANRLAYFLMRISAILYLGLLLYFTNVPGNDCKPFYASLLTTWYITLVSMDFIFVSRTLALYGWQKEVAIPIGTMFLTYTGISAYITANIGKPYDLTGRLSFCAGYTTDHERSPFRQLLIAYYAISCTCDTIVLFLTIYKLARMPADFIRNGPDGQQPKIKFLSKALLVQGFIFYGLFWGMKVLFMIVHYETNAGQSWLVVVFGYAAAVDTIVASMLIRQTSELVRQTQKRSSYYSSNLSQHLSPEVGNDAVRVCSSCSASAVAATAQMKAIPRRSELIVIGALQKEKDEEKAEGFSFNPTGK